DRGRRLRLSQTGFDRRGDDVGKDLAHRLASGRRNGLREQFDRPRVDVEAMALAVEYGEALADALEQPREPTAPSVHHLGDDADQGSGAHEEHERDDVTELHDPEAFRRRQPEILGRQPAQTRREHARPEPSSPGAQRDRGKERQERQIVAPEHRQHSPQGDRRRSEPDGQGIPDGPRPVGDPKAAEEPQLHRGGSRRDSARIFRTANTKNDEIVKPGTTWPANGNSLTGARPAPKAGSRKTLGAGWAVASFDARPANHTPTTPGGAHVCAALLSTFRRSRYDT